MEARNAGSIPLFLEIFYVGVNAFAIFAASPLRECVKLHDNNANALVGVFLKLA